MWGRDAVLCDLGGEGITGQGTLERASVGEEGDMWGDFRQEIFKFKGSRPGVGCQIPKIAEWTV